jgi:multidrug transporter EmrE-like cation transporter
MIFLLPIVLAVLGNVLYHSSQKLTPAAVHPLLSIGVSFSTAALLSFAGYAAVGGKTFAEGLRQVNMSALGVGVAIVVIETSFLLAYRRGWPVGLAGLIVAAGQTALLVPLGRLYFAERLSPLSWAGAALCLAGLALVCLQTLRPS